jgi:pimeloyl-ACP methyl ester carboxylesterase
LIRRKTTKVSDIDIAYSEWGSGDPLILVMGYAGCVEIWEPRLIENLSRNFRVIALDNRGMGFSTMGNKEYTFPQLADDLAGFMDALNIKQAGILGYSMGTYIAQEFAIRHPEKTTHLILYAADCGGKEAVLCDPKVREALSNPPEALEEAEKMFIEHLFPADWLKENPNPKIYPPDRPIPQSENIRQQFMAWVKWEGAHSGLSGLKMPVLAVAGSEDVMIPPENIYIIGSRIKNSWTVKIEGGGHGIMYQYPDYMSGLIGSFMMLSKK